MSYDPLFIRRNNSFVSRTGNTSLNFSYLFRIEGKFMIVTLNASLLHLRLHFLQSRTPHTSVPLFFNNTGKQLLLCFYSCSFDVTFSCSSKHYLIFFLRSISWLLWLCLAYHPITILPLLWLKPCLIYNSHL